MKYKFVYDKGFLDDNFIELSESEARVVIATITGGHHALFYGYKPERLAYAIRKLTVDNTSFTEVKPDISSVRFIGGGPGLPMGVVSSANNGYLYMKDLNDFTFSILTLATVPLKDKRVLLSWKDEVVSCPADFQLIATSEECDWNKVLPITEFCGIVYRCDGEVDRKPYSISKLKFELNEALIFHSSLSGTTRNCNITGPHDANFTFDAKCMYNNIVTHTDNARRQLNIASVGRTVADLNHHCMTRTCDLIEALDWYVVPNA